MFLRAIDIQTGKIAWEIPQIGARASWGGLMATAGGLVFFGDDSGAFVAADAQNRQAALAFPHQRELECVADDLHGGWQAVRRRGGGTQTSSRSVCPKRNPNVQSSATPLSNVCCRIAWPSTPAPGWRLVAPAAPVRIEGGVAKVLEIDRPAGHAAEDSPMDSDLRRDPYGTLEDSCLSAMRNRTRFSAFSRTAAARRSLRREILTAARSIATTV